MGKQHMNKRSYASKADKTCSVLPLSPMKWTIHNTTLYGQCAIYGLVWHKSDENATLYSAFTTQTFTMSLIAYRPSDKRSPGKDPRLQYAFENQVLGVSCISHRLTQLAAFFIDQRTEWSTVCSCTAYSIHIESDFQGTKVYALDAYTCTS